MSAVELPRRHRAIEGVQRRGEDLERVVAEFGRLTHCGRAPELGDQCRFQIFPRFRQRWKMPRNERS